ncbi:hypothetical protein Cni_G04296 [Canna indica]|uniref:J domain-containing protein n=1 Tax=Canna indica TaxID=4628 RepID=A0AAQ3Q4C7_9LILI|nr:hypothetical protein Cni_G04296 [Canna indica]
MSSRDEKGDHSPWQERERSSRAWRAVIFGVVGVTATSLVAGQLRKTAEWVYTQLSRLRTSSASRNTENSSNNGGFRQEAWKRYYRTRMQEEYEDERERVERIRRMQSVFNREREKRRKSYQSWIENDPGTYQYIPREDWYYEAETSYRKQRSTYNSTPKYRAKFTMSHHYTVLGLDRTRAEPYSDAEIKTAFRAKAMEYHPDQNQENKETAEAKFKEVMTSYDAIKLERKSQDC